MFKRLFMPGLLLLGFLGMQAQNTETSKAIVQQEIMFPFQSEHTHGSSIVQLPNGDLLSCWFQGNGERNADDVRVMGSRQKKGTTIWATPFLMADTKGIPDCNPVLFLNKERKLFLFWVAVQANQWQYSVLRFRTATKFMNEGAPIWDWQDDILLKPDDSFAAEVARKFKDLDDPDRRWAAYAPKYDDMIIEASVEIYAMKNGKWLYFGNDINDGRYKLSLYLSDDEGNSWYKKEVIEYSPDRKASFSYPCLIQTTDGLIHISYSYSVGSKNESIKHVVVDVNKIK